MKSSSGLSKRVARLTKGTASGRLRESVGLDVWGHEPDAIQAAAFKKLFSFTVNAGGYEDK